MKSISKYIFSFLFLILFQVTYAQYVSEIIEYKPAPGQYINDPSFGTPQAAQSIIGSSNGLVSLGAFGGYIIVKMDHSIENHSYNPFGMDFTIFSNASLDWSEAAIVEVMKDENNNGLADDEWYLLAGSDYYLNNNIKDYEVTYINPHQNSATDVKWVDNQNDSGFVYRNNFHTQVYYPLPENFPSINQDSYTLKGNKIKGHIDRSNPSFVKSYKRYFGYADNLKKGSEPWTIPDNPYTEELENAGGDAMDISWAIDAQGNKPELDKIDFIKITNGMNASAGALGEISTEISGIVDVSPNSSITGETHLLALSDHDSQINIATQLQLEAIHFESGIPSTDQDLIWTSSNTQIASINSSGLIQSHQAGTTQISVALQSQTQFVRSFQLTVIQPSSILIDIPSQSIHKLDLVALNQIIYDQNNEEINGLNVNWFSSNDELLEIYSIDNSYYMKGLQEGEVWLKATLTEYPQLKDSVLINIFPEAQNIKVFIGVQTESNNIIPRQAINIENFDLTPFVETTSNDYSLNSIQNTNLAHAIVGLFKSLNLQEDIRFKDDELNNQQLYIWKIPEKDGDAINYIYGFGGNNQDENKARSWMVKLNGQTFARDFHEIEIQENDEILLYHITDSRNPWSINQLILNTDTATTFTNIEATYINENCQFFSNGLIESLDTQAIAAANLYLNDEVLFYQDQAVVSNQNGQAVFKIEQQGTHIISIKEQKNQLIIDNATTIDELKKTQINIFPNPFEESFQIAAENKQKAESIFIYNAQGQLVKELHETNRVDMSKFESGFYLCQILIEGKKTSKRIIKK